MDAATLLQNEEHRGEVYRLLSRCYYLPDEYTLAQVAELIEALKAIYPETAELALNMSGEMDLEQQKIDFSRLFVGPFKVLAPPYGSVYLEPGRRVMGDSTVDARNRYREAGLDFSDNLKEAPDHIAFELEFMYYLIYKELEALASSDRQTALAFLKKRWGFLVDHLGAWISDFAGVVEENATTNFYKSLARLTKVFVQKDKAEISRVALAKLVDEQQTD